MQKQLTMKRLFLLTFAMFALSTAMASVDEQQPLFILDGKVISNEQVKEIPAADIESMSILKDEWAKTYAHLGDISNGVILITLKSGADNQIFVAAEVMPTFMGGDLQTFQNWFMQSVRYPAEAVDRKLQDNVVVSFVVNREGYIDVSNVEFLEIEHDIFKGEIYRILASSPRWTPGMEGGKAVAVRFVLPIVFKM